MIKRFVRSYKGFLKGIGQVLQEPLTSVLYIWGSIGMFICIPFGSIKDYKEPITMKEMGIYILIGAIVELGFIFIIIWGLLKW